jgi:FixJ family two-component response regulator
LRRFASRRPTPRDVIVADEQMRGMRGCELLAIIAREFPAAGRILLTGLRTLEAAVRAVHPGGIAWLLLKPPPAEEVQQAVEAALAAGRSYRNATPRLRALRGRYDTSPSSALANPSGSSPPGSTACWPKPRRCGRNARLRDRFDASAAVEAV